MLKMHSGTALASLEISKAELVTLGYLAHQWKEIGMPKE